MGVLDRVFLFLYSLVIALFILLGTVCVVMLEFRHGMGKEAFHSPSSLRGTFGCMHSGLFLGLSFFS